MYYYIYDEFIQDKKYERELIMIENRLADLGIAGRVARLALFKDAGELISDELRRGTISTVVVVGNDDTIQKVIDAVSEHDVPFGIIPLGDNNHMARILGIPHGVEAVDVLSARNIQTLDAGRLNGERFITEVRFPRTMGKLTCDGSYTITSKKPGTIDIINLDIENAIPGEVDPTDGELKAIINVPQRSKLFGKKGPKQSVVGSKAFELEYEEPVVAMADGREVEGAHFSITVEPKALRVITGRERMF